MNRRTAFSLMLTLPALAHATREAPAEVLAELPGARLQGNGRLRFMAFKVYDIHLWVGERGMGPDWSAYPLALEIAYARTLKGEAIAERSLTEMRRQTEIDPERSERWLATMNKLFTDVHEGDRITGVQRPAELARFYINGRLQGDVRDAEFARLFFGIWLSPRSSEPALRSALLGGAR